MSEERPVRHRDAKRASPTREFWRKCRVELLGLLAVGLGVFLLLEQLNIRRSLAVWFRRVLASLLARFQHLDTEIGNMLARVSLSDLLGAVLIVGAVLAILLRLRWRLMNDPKLSGDGCPRCGSAIHRVHRKWYDRVICLYVPVRRYCCYDSDCRWRGLKVGKHHGSEHRRAPAPS